MTKLQKWQILNSSLVINNQWCQVRQDAVKLPNGKIIDDFFVNVRPDIAVVLAIAENREIIFVRQYRHGVGEILLELPAGAFNPQLESSISAAAREFTEETGYIAQKLTPLAVLYENPVKDTNKIHLFLGENLCYSGKQKLDVTEEIEVVLLPVEQVLAKISAGEINVIGTIAAIFLGLNFWQQQPN